VRAVFASAAVIHGFASHSSATSDKSFARVSQRSRIAATAALLATIDTLISSNLDNAAVLASIISLVQSIIDRNALSTIGNTSTMLFVTTVPENPNQTQMSPN
jgi:hypothetical protein